MKTLKNILKTAGFCAISAIAGVYLLPSIEKKTPVNSPSNRRLQRTEMQSDNLLLNRDNQIYFATNKNEEQGINNIKRIIDNSKYEELWLYLPEKQKWYEIGINSYIDEEGSKVENTKNDIKKILEKEKIKELIFYHNHNYFPHPSTNDIASMMQNTLYFSNYKIKEKICSKYGITEYFLTEKAIKEFKSKDSINFEDYSTYNQENNSITFNPEYFNMSFKPFKNKK